MDRLKILRRNNIQIWQTENNPFNYLKGGNMRNEKLEDNKSKREIQWEDKWNEIQWEINKMKT